MSSVAVTWNCSEMGVEMTGFGESRNEVAIAKVSDFV